jgi:WhiB family transcriptional regulator, redox-sensing transcriptional regulator
LTTLALNLKHHGDKVGTFVDLLSLPPFFGEASCAGKDPEIFDGETLAAIVKAKKICNGCPIRDECARWAMQTQEYGVWGSLTPNERAKKAKGTKVIDITGLRLLDNELEKLASNSPIAELAIEFKVTKRTIHRWRKKIFATQKAS